MIFSISWRNIWRNKVRSFVVITAVALGICAGVFSTTFMKGMMDQRIQQAISTEISHIQIHRQDYRQESSLQLYMNESPAIVKQLESIDYVKGVSQRIIIQSMVSSAETSSGVKISGIYPENEQNVTNLSTKIVEGKYFEGVPKNPVVIGKKLAKKLNVKLHSKIVITLQDMDKNITAGAFRIAGIFETPNSIYNEMSVFVRYNDLSRLLNLPEGASHEIAILVDNNEMVASVQDEAKALVADYEVLNWKEISPEMGYMTEVMDLYMYIFIMIILLALLFGIINTMLMVILERVKEIGMLMAVGMNRLKVFTMIVVETVQLSLVGGVAGVIVGSLISKYFETHAINLSIWAKGYSQLGYDTMVYCKFEPEMAINVTILVILTGIIAALYPAYKALKYDPAEALRME
jgi:ABC-type lipoprotein release transport system permease subunit